MKILSRDFTLKEKILLLVLGLLLVGLAYYRFVWMPTTDAVAAANSERDTLQIELLDAMTKEAQLRKMQTELDSLGELKETSRMESYNNTKAELSLLNNVLEAADDYVRLGSDVACRAKMRRPHPVKRKRRQLKPLLAQHHRT